MCRQRAETISRCKLKDFTSLTGRCCSQGHSSWMEQRGWSARDDLTSENIFQFREIVETLLSKAFGYYSYRFPCGLSSRKKHWKTLSFLYERFCGINHWNEFSCSFQWIKSDDDIRFMQKSKSRRIKIENIFNTRQQYNSTKYSPQLPMVYCASIFDVSLSYTAVVYKQHKKTVRSKNFEENEENKFKNHNLKSISVLFE